MKTDHFGALSKKATHLINSHKGPIEFRVKSIIIQKGFYRSGKPDHQFFIVVASKQTKGFM